MCVYIYIYMHGKHEVMGSNPTQVSIWNRKSLDQNEYRTSCAQVHELSESHCGDKR